ncbi:MAG: phage shock protein [Devosia sp.]|uniref:PspA/IM30 family protein n=1 Tax=Devosia sp. TaxID=1871048 RepID=UPI0026102D71|nr:PspA/IM30 family protein [Devosia sp.]MDB5587634.1 phage shock protein [Devosia sp.]
MLDLISTLFRGANAKATETVTDHFAIDLINQKIREAEAGVEGAKHALAALIVRQRAEQKTLDTLGVRKAILENRVREALAAGNEALALEGADAIAQMENEMTVRAETLARLSERVARLRQSVEQAHRRVADLRQNAIAARAIDLERRSQRRLNRSLDGGSAIHEAEKLIQRVTEQDDPFQQSSVLDEIDDALSHRSTEDNLAAAGFGPATKTRAQDVLARLRNA